MDAAGFAHTQIIIPDGGFNRTILTDFDADPAFEAAVAGIGLHYPCNNPQPEVTTVYHKKYWASEDYSTVGDWGNAGYLGNGDSKVLNACFSWFSRSRLLGPLAQPELCPHEHDIDHCLVAHLERMSMSLTFGYTT